MTAATAIRHVRGLVEPKGEKSNGNSVALLLSSSLVSLVLVAPPSFASSLSDAQFYAEINADGDAVSGAINGITDITNPSYGIYCIEPNTVALRDAVAAGAIGVQLTIRTPSWNIGRAYFIYQVQASGVCPTNYVGVQEFELDEGVLEPTTSAPSGAGGYAQFTIMFE
jgi:hypothetical protein